MSALLGKCLTIRLLSIMNVKVSEYVSVLDYRLYIWYYTNHRAL